MQFHLIDCSLILLSNVLSKAFASIFYAIIIIKTGSYLSAIFSGELIALNSS